MGPIDKDDFHSADFKALESYEIRKRADPVIKALESVAPSASKQGRYVVLSPGKFSVLMLSQGIICRINLNVFLYHCG